MLASPAWPQDVPEGDPRDVDSDFWDSLPPAWRCLKELPMTFEEHLNDLVDGCMADPDVDRTDELISAMELKIMALREQQAANDSDGEED